MRVMSDSPRFLCFEWLFCSPAFSRFNHEIDAQPLIDRMFFPFYLEDALDGLRVVVSWDKTIERIDNLKGLPRPLSCPFYPQF
jgi:methyl coenzyme M reductase subunit C-like uncharacterized protein (methanogenesis marker protein 7)